MSEKRNRANNAVFSEILETRVAEVLNNQEASETLDFEVEQEARRIADKIREITPVVKAERIGQFTSDKNGDILINGETVVELKSVANSGTGTYFNTTINSFSQIVGTEDYRQFLENHGFYEKLAEITKIPFSTVSNSPFDRAGRKQLTPTERKQIGAMEAPIRKQYVETCFKAMIEGDKTAEILAYYLNKGKKDGKPDFLVVSNRKKKAVMALKSENIGDGELQGVRLLDRSISFDGIFRLAFGWQNGSGLTNPTIRVFLEE